MSQQLSAGQALARALLKMGTSRVYGIIGTSNVAFVDALYEVRDRIHYVSCRHEQVAASMADAEGRLTGRPGVALVHSGPGALNAMISAGNAYKDCSPMIIITGAVKRRLAGSDGMLEVDHRRLFAPLCKATFRVESASEVPGVFSAAYRAAMSGARGPVLIEVPEDVWAEKVEIDIEGMELACDAPPPVKHADVTDALAMIESARLPLVLAGAGVAYSHSRGDLVKFAEALSLPVMRAMPKSTIFGVPSAMSRMLPGLMSRWRMPWLWAKARPSATWPMSRTASWRGSRPSRVSRSRRLSPSTYSMAR